MWILQGKRISLKLYIKIKGEELKSGCLPCPGPARRRWRRMRFQNFLMASAQRSDGYFDVDHVPRGFLFFDFFVFPHFF